MEVQLYAVLISALIGGVRPASCPGPSPPPPQGKSPWYPLEKRLDGPQSWSVGCGKEGKNLTASTRKQTLVIQPVA